MISVRDGTAYVAMIATRGRTRWGLPKGAVAVLRKPFDINHLLTILNADLQ